LNHSLFVFAFYGAIFIVDTSSGHGCGVFSELIFTFKDVGKGREQERKLCREQDAATGP